MAQESPHAGGIVQESSLGQDHWFNHCVEPSGTLQKGDDGRSVPGNTKMSSWSLNLREDVIQVFGNRLNRFYFLLFEKISVCLFFLCGSEEIQSMLEQGFLRHGDNLVVRWIPHYSHDLSHFHLLSCTFISSQRWKLKQYSYVLEI